MPTYIGLLRYTDDGMRNVKESPARVEAARKLFQSLGADLKQFYLTASGQHDAILVIEAPDDETVTRAGLQVQAAGAVRVEAQRVYTEPEFRSIIASLR